MLVAALGIVDNLAAWLVRGATTTISTAVAPTCPLADAAVSLAAVLAGGHVVAGLDG
jgi:hypothetical protein